MGKGGKVMQFTADGIFKNLQLVQEARGKKVRIASRPLASRCLNSSLLRTLIGPSKFGSSKNCSKCL